MRPGVYIPVAITTSDETASAGCAASGQAAEAEPHMDEAAFREFYYQTAPGLRAFIYRACGDAALADDLLQDTFYRFLHADLPPFGRRQMKAYLYRTAGSLLADHWRRLKRQRRWSLENFFGAEPAKEQQWRRRNDAVVPALEAPGTVVALDGVRGGIRASGNRRRVCSLAKRACASCSSAREKNLVKRSGKKDFGRRERK